MRFSPLSFVLGLAAASLIPVLSRVFRPLAVEATAAGMGMLEDARRVFAEQMENLEDVIAEAQARREQLDAETQATATDEASSEASRPAAGGHALAHGVRDAARDLDHRVRRVTRGVVGLGGLVPSALILWAVAEVVRGRVRPLAWSSALWYAYGLFRDYVVETPRD